MFYSRKENIKQIARELRRRQTPAEKFVWEIVRNRKLNGVKFLRQHPIEFSYNGKQRFFIADFYCAEKRLVIELDGKIHEQQKEYDAIRDEILTNLGLIVLRIKNEETEDRDRLIIKIIKAIENSPPE